MAIFRCWRMPNRIRMWSVSSYPRLTFINHLLSTETVLILMCSTKNRSSITTYPQCLDRFDGPTLHDTFNATKAYMNDYLRPYLSNGNVIRNIEQVLLLNQKIYPGMMTSSNGKIFRVTALCAGNSPVIGGFHSQRPVTRSFDVFCNLCLNKPVSTQSWGCMVIWDAIDPLWRHCNGYWRKLLYAHQDWWQYFLSFFFLFVFLLSRISRMPTSATNVQVITQYPSESTEIFADCWGFSCRNPDNKVHGANMGPTWVLSARGRPHVSPKNIAIRDCTRTVRTRALVHCDKTTPQNRSYSLKHSPHWLFYDWSIVRLKKRVYAETKKPSKLRITGPL